MPHAPIVTTGETHPSSLLCHLSSDRTALTSHLIVTTENYVPLVYKHIVVLQGCFMHETLFVGRYFISPRDEIVF
jgi:hypothetical protein